MARSEKEAMYAMTISLNPYLTFRDNAREAMSFYRSVFGGELAIKTYAELRGDDPAKADKVVHAVLTTPDGHTLMGADAPDPAKYEPRAGFSISLSGDDEERLRAYWERLSDGGTIVMPLERAPWGDVFGKCVDRFGTSWLVNVEGA